MQNRNCNAASAKSEDAFTYFKYKKFDKIVASCTCNGFSLQFLFGLDALASVIGKSINYKLE